MLEGTQFDIEFKLKHSINDNGIDCFIVKSNFPLTEEMMIALQNFMNYDVKTNGYPENKTQTIDMDSQFITIWQCKGYKRLCGA